MSTMDKITPAMAYALDHLKTGGTITESVWSGLSMQGGATRTFRRLSITTMDALLKRGLVTRVPHGAAYRYLLAPDATTPAPQGATQEGEG